MGHACEAECALIATRAQRCAGHIYKAAWEALQSRAVAHNSECWWCRAGEEEEQLASLQPELARLITQSEGNDVIAEVGQVE